MLMRPFLNDRRGVSALEFALIAPILILMYVGMADVSSIMMAQRRSSHATSASGDLLAQFATVSPSSDLPNVFQAANDILAPYPTGTFQLRITSLIVDSESTPVARVNWSCATTTNSSLNAYAAGTQFAINGASFASAGSGAGALPAGLVSSSGDSIVIVESTYPYTPPANLTGNMFGGGASGQLFGQSMTFTSVSFFKPRQSVEVTLTMPNGQSPAYTYTAWNTSSSQSNRYTVASGSGTPGLTCYYQSG